MSWRARVQKIRLRAIRRTFGIWKRLGFYVIPAGDSQPIPELEALPPSLWGKPADMPGIDLDEAGQLRLAERFQQRYRDEYGALPRERTSSPHGYFVNNGYFEAVDGEVLYSMVRDLTPRRIIEVGSGYSTYLAAQAAAVNEAGGAAPCELIAIEPHPNPVLRRGFPGLTRLIRAGAETVRPELFESLEENDILFIDSSHVLRTGGDVQHLYLQVLPRLRPGVVVHAHDIFLPSEYPREWIVDDMQFLSEQYVLQAFLALNGSFRVLWGSSFMHTHHPDALVAAFPSYAPGRSWPASFWMRRIA
ncbi:MAG: class I SAM-dependent methyltransferase [Actinobacteria bacterium]|nr:class I SAM-dependent methyltransferase [Actinomycetota bacterium]